MDDPEIKLADFEQQCEVAIDCNRKHNFDIPAEDAAKLLPFLQEDTVFYSLQTKDGADFRVSLTPRVDGSIRGEIISVSGHCKGDEIELLNDAQLIIHFPDMVLRLTVHCPYQADMLEMVNENSHTWLCLDLGNTRTCAQLDLPDKEIVFYNVRFNPHYPNSKKPPQVGTLESICAAVKEKSYNESVSFVTFGKNDTELYRRSVKPESFRDRFLLSSPKRYFWDNVQNENWRKASSTAFLDFGTDDAPEMEKEILGRSRDNTVSPQQLFQGAIIELIEQAEQTLAAMKKDPREAKGLCSTAIRQENLEKDWDRFSREALQPIKGITDVVMTCPAAWSEHERYEYETVIGKACQLYASNRVVGCRPLNFKLSCDEATAVLMYYIREQLKKKQDSNILSWLYENGKMSSGLENIRVRIGVLDIGGGTSDLTIAELRGCIDRAGLDSIAVGPLYSDGTNHAGDELLQKLVNIMLIDMVKKSLLKEGSAMEDNSEKSKQFDDFFYNVLTRTDKNSAVFDQKVRPFARGFWFELAVEALGIMQKSSGQKDLKIEISNESNASYAEGYRDFITIIQDFGEDFIRDNSEDFDFDATEHILIFPEDWEERYQKAVKDSFEGTASLLCSAVMAYDCDYLLFSGKTLENKMVQSFFRKYLPCRCEEFPKDMDSKRATAIGAEYFVRRDEEDLGFQIAMQNFVMNDEGAFYWMVKEYANRNPRPISSKESENSFRIQTNRSDLVIYKIKSRNLRNNDPVPCYRLKLRPEIAQNHKTSDHYTITLQYGQVSGQDFKSLNLVSAQKLDGTPADEVWDLTVCMTTHGQLSWLDSGEILLDDKNKGEIR